MEENQNKESQSKANESKTSDKKSNPLGGFDMKDIPEWLYHLLTGVGTMGANYLLWIKPLQDKLEKLTLQFTKQESQIRELEKEQSRLIREMEKEIQKSQAKDAEIFNLKRNNNYSDNGYRSRTARM